MKRFHFLAVVAIAAMACAPAHRLDFIDTSWLISRVGSAEIPLEDRARVTFRIEEVQVDLGCGSITDHLLFDSDGSALSLLGVAAVAGACSGQTTQVERTQLEGLRDVTSWRIETNDRIVLEGGPEVTLERLPKQ